MASMRQMIKSISLSPPQKRGRRKSSLMGGVPPLCVRSESPEGRSRGAGSSVGPDIAAVAARGGDAASGTPPRQTQRRSVTKFLADQLRTTRRTSSGIEEVKKTLQELDLSSPETQPGTPPPFENVVTGALGMIPRLEVILLNTAGPPFTFESFHEFAREQLLEENVDFWGEVQRFRSVSDEDYWVEVRRIFNTYIRAESEREVNLGSALRTELRRTVTGRLEQISSYEPGGMAEAPPADRALFDGAQRAIFQLLLRDAYPRYIEKSTQHLHNFVEGNERSAGPEARLMVSMLIEREKLKLQDKIENGVDFGAGREKIRIKSPTGEEIEIIF
ncbi:unnamed protein product [Phaeothamnion confervicola]